MRGVDQLVMTRAEDLDGALCPASDPSRLGGSGRLHDESGVKEKAPPSPSGGGADDISCLCSFLDVPPDKAIRGARDGSPSGLVSEAKSEAEIFLWIRIRMVKL